jgi:hypothetical protein
MSTPTWDTTVLTALRLQRFYLHHPLLFHTGQTRIAAAAREDGEG